MSYLSKLILYFFFPSRCPVCHGLLSFGQSIHPSCFAKLSFPPDSICMRCGRPLLYERREYCSSCEKHIASQKPGFCRARGIFLYQGGIRLSLYRFKYSNRREYAGFFAACGRVRLGKWLRNISPDLILPVPMYMPKQKKRGYNQAETFAKALSRVLDIPYACDLLFRQQETKALKTMNEKARRRELSRAFSVSGSYDAAAHPVILLVDDIFTTGATADAVSAALLAAGAREVYVLTIATSSAEIL